MSNPAKLLVVLSCLLFPLSGAAQGLDRIEDLALSGRAEEARELLTTWWPDTFQNSSRIDRQKALWLRGLLTVDPLLAELDFQRLVVEYPGGPFTAEALLRLGGAAAARDDLAEAEDHFRMLLRDYPGSRYQTVAYAWLDSRGSVRAPPILPREVYAVQLGAFSSESRALTLSEAVAKAGFTVRVVQVEGSNLFRVRVGAYRTPDEAGEEMARVIDSGFEATLVRNADQEVS